MKYFLLPIPLCMLVLSHNGAVASLSKEEPLKEGTRLRILQRGASTGIGEEPPKTREEHLVRACTQLRSEVEEKSTELQSAQDKITQLEEELTRAKKAASKLQSERDSYQNQLRVAIQAIGQRDPSEVEELKRQLSVVNMHNHHLQQQLTLRQQERDKSLCELSLFRSYAKSDAIGYQEALANKDMELKCLMAELDQVKTNPFLIKGTLPIDVFLSETEVVPLELTLSQMYGALVNGKTIYDLANEQKAREQEQTPADVNEVIDQEIF